MKISVLSASMALSVFCICLCPAARTQASLKLGAPAPDLAFRAILGAPAATQATWQELKGKAVVIEFWATWCGFCVDSIPHLNQLAETFNSRPVQFISVTDETDVRLVRAFLKVHPIAGWVAFDDNETTFARFGVGVRPDTVLVDAHGIVRGIVNPEQVTPETLDDLLAEEPLEFAAPPESPILGLEPHAPPPLFQVLIRPAAPVAVSEFSPGWETDKQGRLTAYGHSLLQILAKVYRVPQDRVEAPRWCSTSLYDVSVVLPQGNHEPTWPLIKQPLAIAFGLKTHMEMKETVRGRLEYLVVDSIIEPKTQ